MPQCALCLRDRPLLRSHIIPEFMYEAVYDQKHRFRIIYTGAEYKERWAQKGLREPLLCEICEGQISSYERYVSLIFSGAINTTAERERQFQKISGLDYSQFKLFALSVLWRASATDLPFFFEREPRQVSRIRPKTSRSRRSWSPDTISDTNRRSDFEWRTAKRRDLGTDQEQSRWTFLL